jgi:hypothetical protein
MPIKMGDIENGQSIDYEEFESEAPEPNHLGDDPMSITNLINEGKCFYVLKFGYRKRIAAR